MKIKSLLPISLLIPALVFSSCSGKTAGSGVSEADRPGINSEAGMAGDNTDQVMPPNINYTGDYVVPEGDTYIGVTYYFPDDNSIEMRAVCVDDIIIDCSCNRYTRSFDKTEYIGKNFEQAFIDFYRISLEKLPEDQIPVRIAAVISDDDPDPDRYKPIFERIRNELLPDAEPEYYLEQVESFRNFVAVQNDEYVDELARQAVYDEEARKRDDEEARKRDEEEAEKKRNEELLFLETTPVLNASDILERYDKGVHRITLGADISIDVSTLSVEDMYIDCDGHSVVLTGTMKPISYDGRHNILDFENASSIDMSGLVINKDYFNDDDWVGKAYGFVQMRNMNFDNVIFPDDLIPAKYADPIEIAPFKGQIRTDIDEAGVNGGIVYQGPSVTYEARNEQDTEVLNAILTQGDAYELFDEWHHAENNIWTDVEIDIGNSVLPNQDYMGFKIMPGAHVKITGSLTVTGGRPGWEVTEYDQLDITGLTIIKSHPSPDVLKIRFDPNVGVNTALITPICGGGKMYCSLGTDSYDISIW